MADRNISANLILQLREWARGWKAAAQQGQQALRGMQGATGDFGNKAEGSANKARNAFSRLFGGMKAGFGGAIRNIAQMTIAFAGAQAALMGMQAAVRGFIGSFIGFESTLVKTINLTSLTEEELGKVQQRLTDMAPEISKAPTELADGFYFAVSALGDTDKALAALDVSARGSAIGMGETVTIVDAVTSAMNAYNLQADEAGRVTDTLAGAIKAGKMEPAELAQNLGMVLPMASFLGVSLEEVTANLATMSRIGLGIPEGTTALRGFFNAIIKGSPASEKALKEVGLSFKELRDIAGKDGLLAVLEVLMEKTGGNIDMIAEIIPNVRALTAVLATAGVQMDTYGDILEDIEGSGGIVAEGFERYTNTFEYQSNRFREIVRASFYDFAANVLPYVTSALEAFSEFLRSGMDLEVLRTELKERLGVDIQGIIPILQTLGAGIQTISQGIGKLIGFLREHKTAAIAAAVALGVLFAWMHPLLGAILGIIFVVGLLRENWDMLAQKIEWLRDVIHRNFAWVEEYIRNVWGLIYNNIQTAINQVRDIINIVMGVLSGDWGKAWDGLKSLVVDTFNGLLNQARYFGGILKSIFQGVWKGIAWVFVQALNGLIGLLNDFLGGLNMIVGPIRGLLGKIGIDVPEIGKIPTLTAPEFGFDFGGFGGPPGLTDEGKAEVERMKRQAKQYQEDLARRKATEQAAFDNEIERMLSLADAMKNVEEPFVEAAEEEEGAAKAAKRAARSAKGTADNLDTAATSIGKAVEKFIDPIEQAFRDFYWAWRKSGMMWQDFVRSAFAREVPKLQRGIGHFVGGLALVGDRGPELLRLPRGSGVTGAAETARAFAGRGGGRSQVINNDFNISVTGDRWAEIRARVIRMLDESAAEAGITSPLTTGGVGMPRL